ncbi:hypothetical protein Q3A66_04760 [Hymenobacter sp. BT770]|uniref:hypothetical protein n=1 Tax=Hymenobacter sp. BT770 TaxID=2886942 RepID=UPI001D1239E0|nr:hypothetical protein [Hymenobacter sp. BT770]MCC3154186.1 hypothetical protein [Hymenobacter sp. BT770]MDO3414367.1 hypothetical protein [Hymenobacter sp. BT770]
MLKLLMSVVFTVMISLTAFATPPSVVLVQFRGYQQDITVTRGAQQTERIKAPSVLDKNKNASVEQLHALFAKLYQEGYTLQNSSVTGSADARAELVTYVFVKP